MAIFDRMDRMISRTCDRQYSVSAVIDGLKATPNGRPVADPERGEIFVKGIFDQREEMAAIEAEARDGAGNSLRTLVAGYDFVFSVDVTRYPTAREIRQGDRLTLDDARRFEIVSKRDDSLSRTVLHLVAI